MPTTRKIKNNELLTEALREMNAGEILLVPFRRYSLRYMKKLASEIKANTRGRHVFCVETSGRLIDAKITRTR